jgi:hypothetical protein
LGLISVLGGAAGIAPIRLGSQQITSPVFHTPNEVVGHLGAVQAQDYAAMKWAIGLRLPGATEATIEQAISDREIVRTWPLRGTLHVVSAADVHWILALCAPRMIARAAYRHRQLELDDATLHRSVKLLRRALKGGKQWTRPEIAAALERDGVTTKGQRLIHIIQHAALHGVICHGPRRGKQFTFALLDEWVPAPKPLERSDAVAELARRYFLSHGPATIRDFTWWSGLTVADARAGIESAGSQLVSEVVDGHAYWFNPDAAPASTKNACWLLPAFDEYVVAYTDRSASGARLGEAPFPTRGGILDPVVVIDGQVVGTWRRAVERGQVVVKTTPLTRLTTREKKSIVEAARPYGRFLAAPVRVIA